MRLESAIPLEMRASFPHLSDSLKQESFFGPAIAS
jgi:hypothetical protein